MIKPLHLIDWKYWKDENIKEVLTNALLIKRKKQDVSQQMKAETLLMLFEKTSTRTRVSFEAGVFEMGGQAVFLATQYSNIGLSKIRYEAAYLSRNTHMIMARLKEHRDLLEITQASLVSVINGCCNKYHPCQTMADMLTIYEEHQQLDTVALTYIGCYNNVTNSLVSICTALGVKIYLICPVKDTDSVDEESLQKAKNSGVVIETDNVQLAIKNSQYIYTDSWIDMEFFNNPQYQTLKEQRIKKMMPYQINREMLGDNPIKIMHDMPIHPGYEIAEELIEDDNSVIYRQAENRKYAQMSIISFLKKYNNNQ